MKIPYFTCRLQSYGHVFVVLRVPRATSGGSRGMTPGRCWQSAWKSPMPFVLETLIALSLTSQSIRCEINLMPLSANRMTTINRMA